MHRFLLLTIFLIAGWAQVAHAQAGVEVTDVTVSHRFGESISFSARINAASPIQEAVLLFRAEGEEVTRVYPLTLGPEGEANYKHAVQPGTLRPFSRVFYWYRVKLENGEVFTSPQNDFVYDDNRFSWLVIEDALAHIHWYSGDLSFGQHALDTTLEAFQRIDRMFPVSLDGPVRIYIYSSPNDMREALGLESQAWLAGHASPDLGLILVSIPPGPGEFQEMERQIPHELGHLLLFNRVGAAYNRLPMWLREGIASNAEFTPNPDYERMLVFARDNKSIIPLASLCDTFPRDVSGAFLAYAQATSFTDYIHGRYGASGLFALTSAYSDGLNCEQGAARALGIPLSQLEANWRREVLSENVLGALLEKLLPYILFLVLILIVPAWQIFSSAGEGRRNEPNNN